MCNDDDVGESKPQNLQAILIASMGFVASVVVIAMTFAEILL